MWWILAVMSPVALLCSLSIVNVFVRIVSYPIYFTSILALSILLPLSIVYILPIDLISSLGDEHVFLYVKESVLLITWKLNYWATFVLTWLVLPFLQSWFDNGQFNTTARFKASVKEVLKFQLILLVGGVFGLIYIIGSIGFNFTAVKSLVITISHIYALVLALWLMSHSLISIPKNKFLNSSPTRKKLNDYYTKLARQNEDLSDVKYNLKENCGKIMKLNDLKDYNVEFRDWIISLVEQVPQEYADPLWYRGDPITNDQLNNKFMTNITKKFNNSYYKFTATKSMFDDLVDKILELEDILGAEQSKDLNFRFKSSRFSPRTTFYIYRYLLPTWQKLLAFVLALLSFVIIESEVLHSTKFSLINLFFRGQNLGAQVFKNFTTLIWILAYMLMCSLMSLSNVRIFNLYHLSKHQASDPVSVTFFITYAARLTIPLSYNFTMLLNNTQNAFHAFIGPSLTLIPIGNIINDWLPRLILIPLLLSYFNVYERVINFVQAKLDFEFYSYFEELEFENEDEQQNWDIAKRNSMIQQGEKIAQQEANKISNGGSYRYQAQLRPFNIQRSRDVEAMDTAYNMSTRVSSETLNTRSVLLDDFELQDSSGIGGFFARFSNLFGRKRTNYEADNRLIPDHTLDQYRDLEDDDNLVI